MTAHPFGPQQAPLTALEATIPLGYLALGTRSPRHGERVTIGAPWEVFAYRADDDHMWRRGMDHEFVRYVPPSQASEYFRITRERGVLVATALYPHDQRDTGFARVQKRLEPHHSSSILGDRHARAFVTRAQIESLL